MPRFKLLIEYAGTRYRRLADPEECAHGAGRNRSRRSRGHEAPRIRALWLGADRRRRPCARAGGAPRALYRSPARIAAPETQRRASRRTFTSARSTEVPHRFHARHDARRALLPVSDFTPPHRVRRKRSSGGSANRSTCAAMRTAAPAFVGMKDFEAFTDDDPDEKSTRVLVDSLEIVEAGALMLIRVQGSHFLWKMVRRMVGVLAAVGRGDLKPTDAARLLRRGRQRDRRPPALAAPAAGLVSRSGDLQG